MMAAATNGGGQCALPGPLDVCKTPAGPAMIPLPYPNIGRMSQAKGGTCSKKVRILNKKPLRKGSEIARTSGDEAGVGKGLVSSDQMGIAKALNGSSKVFWEGKAAFHQCGRTAHNGSNANAPTGMMVSPSQGKVTVMP